MSMQNMRLVCTGTPDDAAMKLQLGEIPGIMEMNIDSKSHSIDLLYDDAQTSSARIAACVHHPNYQTRG